MVVMPCRVAILGTEYTIERRKFEDEEDFAKLKIDGWCNSAEHKIVFCDMRTHPFIDRISDAGYEKIEKEILRHEVIHAYLNESGLQESSNQFDGAWAKNEEMVDWFALQSPKILETFRQLNIL